MRSPAVSELDFPPDLYRALRQVGAHYFSFTCLFQPHYEDSKHLRSGCDAELGERIQEELVQYFVSQRALFGVNDVDDSRLSILLEVKSYTVHWTYQKLSVDPREEPILVWDEPELDDCCAVLNVSELQTLEVSRRKSKQVLERVHTFCLRMSENPIRDVVSIDYGTIRFYKYCESYEPVHRSQGVMNLRMPAHLLLEAIEQNDLK